LTSTGSYIVGTRVGFFVGIDGRRVLHGGANIVQALQQNFFTRSSDLKLKHQAAFVGDGLVRQIDGQRIAFFLA
jgi:hypothetical protein